MRVENVRYLGRNRYGRHDFAARFEHDGKRLSWYFLVDAKEEPPLIQKTLLAYSAHRCCATMAREFGVAKDIECTVDLTEKAAACA